MESVFRPLGAGIFAIPSLCLWTIDRWQQDFEPFASVALPLFQRRDAALQLF
jgi:hypothetical protein